MSNKYTIPGQPIAWARAGRKGNIYYDSQKKEKIAISNYLRALYRQKKISKGPMSCDTEVRKGPLRLVIHFYMNKPKKYNQKDLFPGIEWYNKRPDLDNMIKFYMDAANGILYQDDAQIVMITASKVYSDNPRTDIIIEEAFRCPHPVNSGRMCVIGCDNQ